MDIRPEYITLDRLIQGRLFRIPEYQRAYSWHRKERLELFDDIRKTYHQGNDRFHFMATVVGLRRNIHEIVTTEYQVIEIVDGQQRITTLIILLKAIAKSVDLSDNTHMKIRQEIEELLIKDDNATLLLLQTNHYSSDYFADYLRQGTHPTPGVAKTVADRELLSAMEDCEQFVADWQEQNRSIIDLLILLKNRLTFVFHEISDESMVYTVFEVLNSRGLEVSWLDRLKSMLMAIVFESKTGNRDEHVDAVHKLWTDIYQCIGLELGLNNESLRFAATLRNPDPPSRQLTEEKSAHLLRDQSTGGPKEVIETTKWLQQVTDVSSRLRTDPSITAVTRIAQARMVATAVYLRSSSFTKGSCFTKDEEASILKRWEIVTFRVYEMFRKDARSHVGDYIRLAWSIVNEDLSANDILDRLSQIVEEYPVDEAVENLRETDCYTNWGEQLRYLLHRYEEYLTREAEHNFDNEQWIRIWESSAANSIEHIRPQSWWTSKGNETDSNSMHRLGNLLILPPRLNARLKDKPEKEKADAYRKTGLLIAQEVSERISSEGWTLEAMKERENRMLEWARREWAD